MNVSPPAKKQRRSPCLTSWMCPGLLLAAASLLLSGCPNMDKQSSYRPYEPARHFPDGASARPIPANTVPRDGEQGGAAFLTGRSDGQPVFVFPLRVTQDLLSRGRERFDIYCAVCHGSDGAGGGIIVRRGFPAPPSFHEDRLRREPPGHFFEVITRGYGVMYSYADRVSPRDRWAIIAYIRALQRSRHATLADVPAGERASLESR